MSDMNKIKAILVKESDEELRKELFTVKKCRTMDEFDDLCLKIEHDLEYRKLFVSKI